MTRRPVGVRTFHPLAVAKSLEAQNEAAGRLLAMVQRVIDANALAPIDTPAAAAQMGAAIPRLDEAAIAFRAAWWPHESGDA